MLQNTSIFVGGHLEGDFLKNIPFGRRHFAGNSLEEYGDLYSCVEAIMKKTPAEVKAIGEFVVFDALSVSWPRNDEDPSSLYSRLIKSFLETKFHDNYPGTWALCFLKKLLPKNTQTKFYLFAPDEYFRPVEDGVTGVIEGYNPRLVSAKEFNRKFQLPVQANVPGATSKAIL